jgi:hypothetical protein
MSSLSQSDVWYDSQLRAHNHFKKFMITYNFQNDEMLIIIKQICSYLNVTDLLKWKSSSAYKQDCSWSDYYEYLQKMNDDLRNLLLSLQKSQILFNEISEKLYRELMQIILKSKNIRNSRKTSLSHLWFKSEELNQAALLNLLKWYRC